MKYRVKRFSDIYYRQRLYGLVEAGRDIAGDTISGAGKVVGGGIGKTAAAIGATSLAASNVGSLAAGGAAIGGSIAPVVGHAVGGLLGAGAGLIAAPYLGAKAAGAVGSTLKNVGEDIHT